MLQPSTDPEFAGGLKHRLRDISSITKCRFTGSFFGAALPMRCRIPCQRRGARHHHTCKSLQMLLANILSHTHTHGMHCEHELQCFNRDWVQDKPDHTLVPMRHGVASATLFVRLAGAPPKLFCLCQRALPSVLLRVRLRTGPRTTGTPNFLTIISHYAECRPSQQRLPRLASIALLNMLVFVSTHTQPNGFIQVPKKLLSPAR